MSEVTFETKIHTIKKKCVHWTAKIDFKWIGLKNCEAFTHAAAEGCFDSQEIAQAEAEKAIPIIVEHLKNDQFRAVEDIAGTHDVHLEMVAIEKDRNNLH